MDSDPLLLEHGGDERRAADDADTGGSQPRERREPRAVDEAHVRKVELDTKSGSARLLAFALEHFDPVRDDPALKAQGQLVVAHLVALDSKHRHPPFDSRSGE
jgi:hypothetical protein